MGDALRAGVRSATGSVAAKRLRGGMVVAEVALSVVFLVAAGLLVRSFVALERASIGYDRAGLVAVRLHFDRPPAPPIATPSSKRSCRWSQECLARVERRSAAFRAGCCRRRSAQGRTPSTDPTARKPSI